MSKRRLTLFIAAAIVALLTIVVARSLMSTHEETASAPVVEATQILAASRDLPTGTIIKESDMKWIPWATEADTSQYYAKNRNDMASLNGTVLREGLRSGEPLIVGRVVQPHDHGFLAAVLSPGKRAMSVTLSPSSEVAGFIFPGDHVDVILTHSFSRKDNPDYTERRVSETVLTDVRVLALDQKSDSLAAADPKVAQLATLEVSPKQAEKLALASDLVGPAGSSSKGSLSLVLRALAVEDQNPAAPGAVGASTLAPPPTPGSTTTWDSEVSPAFPNVNGEDGLMQRVHIMRGKESTDTNFERHK